MIPNDTLDRAIREGRIIPYYQPIVRNTTLMTCDTEALARWIDQDGTVQEPSAFIADLEESHEIWKLDLCVLDQVIADLKRSDEAGTPIPAVSINLSRYDFSSCDIVSEVLNRMDTSGIDHSRISVELTETVFGEEMEKIHAEVQKLIDAGVQVWMDDFGTGYSSMELLLDVGFSVMKMDQSLIRNIKDHSRRSVVISMLINMSRQLGISSLAEGVENHEIYAVLKEMGVEYMQGYWFSEPVPYEKLMELNADPTSRVHFEDRSRFAYLDAIGKVNLMNPMSQGSLINPAKQVDTMIPSAILQYEKGDLHLLRCNWAAFMYFQKVGMLPEDVGDSVVIPFLRKPGAEFVSTVEKCFETKKWEKHVFYDENFNVHSVIALRVVSEDSGGLKSVLVVLLYDGNNTDHYQKENGIQ